MQPLDKLLDYAQENNINCQTAMRVLPDPPTLFPHLAMLLETDEPYLYFMYLQHSQNEGTAWLEHKPPTASFVRKFNTHELTSRCVPDKVIQTMREEVNV